MTNRPTSAQPELTILMPCLNEEENIAYAIRSAMKFLNENKIHGEILIADNQSSDSSVKIAQQEGARVISEPIPGYGSTLRAGINAAKGTYIIMGDCDSTYDFANLTSFWEALCNGADFVIGNRFAGGIEKGAMPFSHRFIGVPVLSVLGRIRFKTRVKDFHCGLRGFRSDIARSLPFQTTGMEFATEMIALFAASGATIKEVPAALKVSQNPRRPHLKAVRDGLRHLKYILFLK